MAKDLERAKRFQRSLWEAAGWQWTAETFEVDTQTSGNGLGRLERKGLVLVPSSAYCGDDDLSSGSQGSNVHSLLKVLLSICVRVITLKGLSRVAIASRVRTLLFPLVEHLRIIFSLAFFEIEYRFGLPLRGSLSRS